jgi:hypothetical protein
MDKTVFIERHVRYSKCNQKMMALSGQASWAKITSSQRGVKLTAFTNAAEISFRLCPNSFHALGACTIKHYKHVFFGKRTYLH